MASGVGQNSNMVHLIIEDDEGQRMEIPITRDEITIGRKDGNTIRLTERNVSRFHARLLREAQDMYIEDLNSSTGVRINGDRISGRAKIQSGDLIEIGDYHLALQQEDGAGLAGSEQTMSDAAADAIVSEATVKMQVMPLDEATVRSPEPAISSEKTTPAAPAPLAPAPVAAAPVAPSPIPAPRAEPTEMIRPDQVKPEIADSSAGEIEEASRAHLVVISTSLAGLNFELSRSEMIVGRVEENDLVLDHRSVSRNHAKLIYDGRQYSVVDLKSANGVLVNGEDYKQSNLRPGDVIELGHVQLRFVEPGGQFVLSEQEISKIRAQATDAESREQGVGTTEKFSRDQVDKELSKRNKTIVIISAVAVLLLLAALVFVFTGDDGKTPPIVNNSGTDQAQKVNTDQAQEPKKAPVEKLSDKQIAAMFDKVTKLIEKGQFDEADGLVGKILRSAPENQRAQDLVRNIITERRAKDDFESGHADEKAGRLEDALAKFESVPEGTMYRKLALKRADVLREKLAKEHEEKARAAFAEDRFDEALQEVEAALERASDKRSLLDLKTKIVNLRKKVGNLPPAPSKNTVTASHDKKGKTGTTRKPRHPKKKKHDTQAAKALYAEGNRLTLQGRPGEAVVRFNRALKADPNFADAHRGLGIAYARLEKADQAVRHYELYIKMRPYAHDADRVRSILRSYYKQQKNK